MVEMNGEVNLEISCGIKAGLASGLQPVLRSLRVFGTDLDVGQLRSKFQRWGFTLSAVLMLVVIISANVIHYCLYPVNRVPQSVYNWSRFVRKATRLTSATLFHTALMSVNLFKWPRLWRIVQQMEQLIPVPVDFYLKLRRTLLIIFTFVIAVVTTNQ